MRVQNRKEQKRKMKKMSMILVLLAALLMAGSALALTDTEAETAARAYVPDGASFLRSEIDDGMYELTFRVEATQEKYEIQVNPTTGAVTKIESELKSASTAKSTTMTAEAVAVAVEAVYPGAQIIRQDEEIDDGRHEIEVFIVAEGLYGTLDLNAENGAIIERELYVGEYAADGMMTEEAARAQIATLKTGAEIIKIKLDEDDGRYFWEGDATLNGSRYEFAIDAVTGTMVEWERD